MPSQWVEFASKQPSPDIPGVQEIEPHELWEKKDQVEIIDVRRPDEFTGELGHVPGSKLIVLDTLPDHISDLPKDRPVVFVCRSGARSGRATAFALREGFTNVFNMKGGMLLWNSLNLEVEGRSEG